MDAVTLAAANAAAAKRFAPLRQPRRRERPTAALAKLTVDQVMASPPTIGAVTPATGIATGTTWYPLKSGVIGATAVDTTAPFDFVGASAERQLGSISPDYSYVAFDSPSHPNSPSATYSSRWMFDGTTCEILFKGYAGIQYQLYVDGQAVAATAPTATGSPVTCWLPVTFSSRAPRLMEFRSALPFGGVRTTPTDTIWKPPVHGGPRVVVLGDSYTGGTGADAPGITSWTQKLAGIMGWPDMWGAGVGGSGYLNAGQGTTFRSRVAADITANNPDIVIVAGGHNDTSYSSAALQAEAALLFQAIKAGTPNCKLVVIGPMGAANAQGVYPAVQTAIFAAAAGYADLTIDTMLAGTAPIPSRPWFFGSGFQGATTGNGNDDFYIWTDNVHPSQAGHDYIARRVAAAIASWQTP